MSSTGVTTAPGADPSLLRRARVVEVLDDLPTWRVAVVSARAGAGKTAALRGWGTAARAGATVDLSPEDNLPSRFLTKLGRALAVEVDGLLHQPHQASPSAVIERILDAGRPRLLVFDAVESIDDPWVLRALEDVLRRATPDSNVVLSGRCVPRLPTLAVMRVRDELVEVTDAQLTLDASEASHLLETLSGDDARPEDLSMLLDMSEGWVTGFRLAARLLLAEGRATDWVPRFETSINDYLLGDVVGRLPFPLAEFLLETSVSN